MDLLSFSWKGRTHLPADLKFSEFADDPELYRRLVSSSHRAAYDLGLSQSATEDVSQTVMLTLSKIPKEKLVQIENLEAYVYRMAQNEAIRFSAKAKHYEGELDSNSAAFSDGSTGASYVEHRVLLKEIWTHLNAEEREILQLTIFGCGAKEIADRLGTTHDAARQRIFRLRKRLRQLVFGSD